jgi:hypothetical protein
MFLSDAVIICLINDSISMIIFGIIFVGGPMLLGIIA